MSKEKILLEALEKIRDNSNDYYFNQKLAAEALAEYNKEPEASEQRLDHIPPPEIENWIQERGNAIYKRAKEKGWDEGTAGNYCFRYEQGAREMYYKMIREQEDKRSVATKMPNDTDDG